MTSAAVLVVGGVALGPAAWPAPTALTESATFDYPSGVRTGFAADLDGDYAVFSQVQGRSVTFAHFTGPAPADWEQMTMAEAAQVTDYGVAVGIDGGRAAVLGMDGTAVNLYVYTRDAGNLWSRSQTITLPAPPAGDTIGGVGDILDMDGPMVAIGAPNSRIGGKSNAGAVYLVNLDTGKIDRITAGTVVASSIFGQSVSVGGGYLAVSSPQVQGTYGEFGAARFRLGRVHLFDLSGSPIPTERVIDYPVNSLTYPAGSASVRPFGTILALRGGLLYAAAPAEMNYTSDDTDDTLGGVNPTSVIAGTTTQGAIYAFDAATGAQVGDRILPPPHSFGFGAKFDVQGDTLVASSYQLDPVAPGRGEVYAYNTKGLFTGAPNPANHARIRPTADQMLRPVNTPNNSFFGSNRITFGGSVRVSGTRVLVGVPEMGTTGKAFVFDHVEPKVPVRTATISAPTVTYGEPSVVSLTSNRDGGDGGTVEFVIGSVKSGPV
ncbi:MAG: hypothetical protein LBK59_11765, partial [Bifidobacteriaceae bacterium]|nr:hypothetical protein [Bifidobacteriaceae bacterium]